MSMKDKKTKTTKKKTVRLPTHKKEKSNGRNHSKIEQENTLIIYYSHLARISASLKMKYSLSSISTLVPPYSGNKTLSPAVTLTGT